MFHNMQCFLAWYRKRSTLLRLFICQGFGSHHGLTRSQAFASLCKHGVKKTHWARLWTSLQVFQAWLHSTESLFFSCWSIWRIQVVSFRNGDTWLSSTCRVCVVYHCQSPNFDWQVMLSYPRTECMVQQPDLLSSPHCALLCMICKREFCGERAWHWQPGRMIMLLPPSLWPPMGLPVPLPEW